MAKRFRNKTFLVSFSLVIVTFVYQIANLLGFDIAIAEDTVGQLINIVITILVGLGIVIDPTTPGIKDGGEYDD